MRAVYRLLLLAPLVVAPELRAQDQQGSAVPFPVARDTTGLFRSAHATVGEQLLIAGQPTEAALRKLKAEGYTTVINLRSPSEMANRQVVPFDEEALVRELGMRYVYLPMRGDSAFPYTPAAVDALARALEEAKGEKVLLHCTIAWRASHLWGAYLIQKKGLPVAEALRYARAINLDARVPVQGRLPIEHFLDRDMPELRQGGR